MCGQNSSVGKHCVTRHTTERTKLFLIFSIVCAVQQYRSRQCVSHWKEMPMDGIYSSRKRFNHTNEQTEYICSGKNEIGLLSCRDNSVPLEIHQRFQPDTKISLKVRRLFEIYTTISGTRDAHNTRRPFRRTRYNNTLFENVHIFFHWTLSRQ